MTEAIEYRDFVPHCSSLPTILDTFRYIVEYANEHNGVVPSIRQIESGTGSSSTSVVYRRIIQMVLLGLLKSETHGSNTAYSIVGSSWIPPVEVPDIDELESRIEELHEIYPVQRPGRRGEKC